MEQSAPGQPDPAATALMAAHCPYPAAPDPAEQGGFAFGNGALLEDCSTPALVAPTWACECSHPAPAACSREAGLWVSSS